MLYFSHGTGCLSSVNRVRVVCGKAGKAQAGQRPVAQTAMMWYSGDVFNIRYPRSFIEFLSGGLFVDNLPAPCNTYPMVEQAFDTTFGANIAGWIFFWINLLIALVFVGIVIDWCMKKDRQ